MFLHPPLIAGDVSCALIWVGFVYCMIEEVVALPAPAQWPPSRSAFAKRLTCHAASVDLDADTIPEVVGFPIEDTRSYSWQKCCRLPKPQPQLRARVVSINEAEMTAQILMSSRETTVDLVPGPNCWAVAPSGFQMLAQWQSLSTR